MATPTVSILLPTYEPKPEHLRETLECLRQQTFTDWTAIIHDDASTSDVSAMIEPYLHDPRFSLVRGDRRRGMGGNWNQCLKQASALFVQFLFQDDFWRPDYLKRCLKVLEADPTLGFVATEKHYQIDGEPQFVEAKRDYYDRVREAQRAIRAGKHDGLQYLSQWMEQGLHPNTIGEPCFVMLRRSIINQVGLFSEELKQGLDMEYWIRCLLKSPWFFLRGELGAFRVHADGTSARNYSAGQGFADRLHCFDLLVDSLPTPALRSEARRIRRRELSVMLAKFLARRKVGGTARGNGGGAMMTFFTKHPVLSTIGVLGYLRKTLHESSVAR